MDFFRNQRSRNNNGLLNFVTLFQSPDIVQSSWQAKDDGTGDKIREVSFTLSLTNSMGYKHSQVTETQVKALDHGQRPIE